MDTIATVNGTVWVFAILLIVNVVVQALLFLRLALNFNKKHKVVTQEEIGQAAKTGALAAVGPSISVLSVLLSLIVLIGSGAAFMRCGVIGAPVFELMIASLCSSTMGVEFGTEAFTPAVFVLCLFGMTLASAPYMLNTIITLKPLDNATEKSKKRGGRSFVPYMSKAAMMAILGYMMMSYVNTPVKVVAAITSAVVCYLIILLGNKVKGLASFGMAIAMIAAMVVGQLITVLM